MLLSFVEARALTALQAAWISREIRPKPPYPPRGGRQMHHARANEAKMQAVECLTQNKELQDSRETKFLRQLSASLITLLEKSSDKNLVLSQVLPVDTTGYESSAFPLTTALTEFYITTYEGDPGRRITLVSNALFGVGKISVASWLIQKPEPFKLAIILGILQAIAWIDKREDVVDNQEDISEDSRSYEVAVVNFLRDMIDSEHTLRDLPSNKAMKEVSRLVKVCASGKNLINSVRRSLRLRIVRKMKPLENEFFIPPSKFGDDILKNALFSVLQRYSGASLYRMIQLATNTTDV